MTSDKSIDVWVRAALRKMGAPSHFNLKWKWNPRMTRAIGRANLILLPKFLGGRDWWMPVGLEFSPDLFAAASQKDRRETVYHEVAHAMDAYAGTYSPRRQHGKTWKELMALAGVPATRCHFVHSKGET